MIQGPIYSQYNIEDHVYAMRNILSESEFILSTNDEYIDKNSLFDCIIYNEDIDALPTLKFNQLSKNNINKQIISSLSGIKKATRPLVLKIRTDQFLNKIYFLEIWNNLKDINRKTSIGNGRILTTSLFSLNPRCFEHMAYHISDMFLFGYKEDIQRYFSCPRYEYENAVWYEYNKHAIHSNKNERKFRSRYAVEQWLVLNYLFNNQKFPINFHNDISKKIIDNFEEFLVDTFIIVHPRDIGLIMPKFERDYDSIEVNLSCYSTLDYLNMLKKRRDIFIDIKSIKIFPHTKITRLFLIFLNKYPYAFKKIKKTTILFQKIFSLKFKKNQI
ncbi:WavE lipopolysaccharide synthesis family protein [Acinetobacter sp. GXMZU3951]